MYVFVDRILYVYNSHSTTVMIYNNPDHLLVDPVLVEVSGGSVVTIVVQGFCSYLWQTDVDIIDIFTQSLRSEWES